MSDECRFCGRWCDPEEGEQWVGVCGGCDQITQDIRERYPSLPKGLVTAKVLEAVRVRGKLEDLEWLLSWGENDAGVLARRLGYKSANGLDRLLARHPRPELLARIVWHAPGVAGGRWREVAA